MKSFTIHYDRTLLLVKGILNLLICISLLTLLGIIPLNPFLVLMVLTVCWFTGKAGGRAMIRFFKHKPLCVIRDKEMEIAMPSGEGKIMDSKDITRIERRDTKTRIQLVIHGSNIRHPSGAYLIDIHYPFAAQKLQSISDELQKWTKKQKIEVQMVNKEKKEVQMSV